MARSCRGQPSEAHSARQDGGEGGIADQPRQNADKSGFSLLARGTECTTGMGRIQGTADNQKASRVVSRRIPRRRYVSLRLHAAKSGYRSSASPRRMSGAMRSRRALHGGPSPYTRRWSPRGSWNLSPRRSPATSSPISSRTDTLSGFNQNGMRLHLAITSSRPLP